MSKPSKRKYVSIEITEKLKALTDLKNGVPITKIAQTLGVAPKTVVSWERNEEKLRKWEEVFEGGSVPTKVKRLNKPHNEKVDQATWIWYKERKAAGLSLDGSTIRTQARWFWNTLGGASGFDASTGWLIRWRVRHGIKPINSATRPSTDKSNSDNLQEVREGFKEKLENIISAENLSPHQIFNCDEISFNYKQLPKKVLGTQLNSPGYTVQWERMTVMVCSNASGSFKLPLMVIGHADDPGGLIRTIHLPVSYKKQRTSSLTGEIFGQWFREEFEPLVKFYLLQAGLPVRAALIMDDCEGHAVNLQSNFVKVEVLKDEVKPMEHGCLQELKMRYRRKLMEHVVGHFNTGAVLLEAVENVTMREAILWIRDCWREITSSTIIKCWEKIWPEISKCPGIIGDLTKYTIKAECEDTEYHEVYFNEVDLVKDQFLFALQKVDEQLEISDIDQWLNSGLKLTEYECLSDNDIIGLVTDQEETEKDNREKEVTKIDLPEALSDLDTIIRHCEKSKYYKPDHITVLKEIQEAMKLEEKQSIQIFPQGQRKEDDVKGPRGPDLIQRYLAAFHMS